jgi:transposase
VKLMPSYVKAYLKRGKNGANDAAAICEAVTRPSMRFVPIKMQEQQTSLMLHRTRQMLVRQRTMLSNAIRSTTVKPSILCLIFALSMRRRAHPSGRNNVWKRSTVHSKPLPSRSI